MSRASACSGLPMLLLRKGKGFGMPYITAAYLCLLLVETSEKVAREIVPTICDMRWKWESTLGNKCDELLN